MQRGDARANGDLAVWARSWGNLVLSGAAATLESSADGGDAGVCRLCGAGAFGGLSEAAAVVACLSRQGPPSLKPKSEAAGRALPPVKRTELGPRAHLCKLQHTSGFCRSAWAPEDESSNCERVAAAALEKPSSAKVSKESRKIVV